LACRAEHQAGPNLFVADIFFDLVYNTDGSLAQSVKEAGFDYIVINQQWRTAAEEQLVNYINGIDGLQNVVLAPFFAGTAIDTAANVAVLSGLAQLDSPRLQLQSSVDKAFSRLIDEHLEHEGYIIIFYENAHLVAELKEQYALNENVLFLLAEQQNIASFLTRLQLQAVTLFINVAGSLTTILQNHILANNMDIAMYVSQYGLGVNIDIRIKELLKMFLSGDIKRVEVSITKV